MDNDLNTQLVNLLNTQKAQPAAPKPNSHLNLGNLVKLHGQGGLFGALRDLVSPFQQAYQHPSVGNIVSAAAMVPVPGVRVRDVISGRASASHDLATQQLHEVNDIYATQKAELRDAVRASRGTVKQKQLKGDLSRLNREHQHWLMSGARDQSWDTVGWDSPPSFTSHR